MPNNLADFLWGPHSPYNQPNSWKSGEIECKALIKKMLKIQSGAHNALKENVGTLTDAQLTEIAKTKMPDLNTTDVEAAMRMVEGTAKQMGVVVE